MTHDDQLSALGDLLETVYHEPATETVPVKPPPPTRVEVRSEVLDAATGDPIEHKIPVTLGAEDYPEKTVEVRHYKRVERTLTEQVDRGPKPYFKIVWSAAGALAGIILLETLLLAPGSIGGYVGAGFVALLGYLAGSYLRETHRETATEEWIVREWEPQTAEVGVPVPERYAPKTEERVVPNPERVVSLGTISLDLRAIETAEGSLVVGPEGLGDPRTLDHPVLEDADDLELLRDRLEALTEELPIVLSSARGDVTTDDPETTFRHGVPLRGEEVELHDLLTEIERMFRSGRRERLDLSVLPAGDPLLDLLEPAEGDAAHGDGESDDALRSLVESPMVGSLESLTDDLLETWSRNTLVLALVRSASLNDLISPAINGFGYVSHYSSFNFYCPHCTASAVQRLAGRDYAITADADDEPIYFSPDSRCLYDPGRRDWLCRGCDRTVEHPIPIHKLLDDVLFPAYDRLIDEHREERLALDNRSTDDITEYRNRWSQETERIEARFQGETTESRSSMEEIEAEIEGDLRAIDGLREVMSQYKLQQTEALEEITARCRRTHDEVAERVRELVSAADERFQGRMAEYRREMDALAVSKRRETLVRDAIQVEIARNSQRIAAASETTAENTGAIRESSRQAVEHLGNIDASTAKSAAHLEGIEQHTAKSAAHLEGIEESSARTAAHTESIEKSSAQAVDKLGGLAEGVKEGNAIAAARAESAGQNVHRYSWFRVDKRLEEGLADTVSTLTGSSDIAKHRRRSEYLDN